MDIETNNQSNASETPQDKYRRIVHQILEREKRRNDSKDVSLQPSYTRFQLPYHIYCHNRYHAAKKKYEQQFQNEISQLVVQQSSGYEAACASRHLCITTIWPPLHNQKEIEHTQRYFFTLSPKQQRRLRWIMSTNIK